MRGPVGMIYLALLAGAIGGMVKDRWDIFTLCVFVMVFIALFFIEDGE